MRAKGYDELTRRPGRPCSRCWRSNRDRRQRPLRRALPQAFLRAAARKRGAPTQPGPASHMNAAFLALALLGTPVVAAPLTVHVGENWLFAIDQGEPVHARKVEASASPAKGEVKVSVRALLGT